ncbi:MAG: FxsA family protein [Cardiobacteriaceae bacterium]|nr:FxsA family protein [Cardiobacteriaceae bacterium]
MPFIALLGFWGVAELVTLIAVIFKVGFFTTLALLFLSSAAGSYLLRSQQEATMRMAQAPNKDVARESIYRMTAGILLIIPGFISSMLALVFLIPPLRSLFAATLLRILQPQTFSSTFAWQQRERYTEPTESHDDVTATREDGTIVHGELMDTRKPQD